MLTKTTTESTIKYYPEDHAQAAIDADVNAIVSRVEQKGDRGIVRQIVSQRNFAIRRLAETIRELNDLRSTFNKIYSEKIELGSKLQGLINQKVALEADIQQLKGHIALLKEENAKLKRDCNVVEIDSQRGYIHALETENQALREENAKLKKQNADLKSVKEENEVLCANNYKLVKHIQAMELEAEFRDIFTDVAIILSRDAKKKAKPADKPADSVIAGIWYDEAKGVTVVKFKDGKVIKKVVSGKDQFDLNVAVAYAIQEHQFGSKSKFQAFVKKNSTSSAKKAKPEAEAKAEEPAEKPAKKKASK